MDEKFRPIPVGIVKNANIATVWEMSAHSLAPLMGSVGLSNTPTHLKNIAMATPERGVANRDEQKYVDV